MTTARVGSATTITSRFWVDEEAVTVTSPTVTVVDDEGSVVLAPTTPVGPDADNIYSYLLPSAALGSITTFTVTWSGTFNGVTVSVVNTLDVQGAHYFDLGDLRQLADLPGRSYSTAQLARARDWAQEVIEGETVASFVERAHVESIDSCRMVATAHGTGLRLSKPFARRIRWARVDGVSASVSAIEISDGHVVAKSGQSAPFTTSSTVEVGYTAGYRTTCPVDLADAAMVAARWHLIAKDGQSGIPDRATSISNEFGNISLSTPGMRGAIVGIPEVDERIRSWADRVRPPLIA